MTRRISAVGRAGRGVCGLLLALSLLGLGFLALSPLVLSLSGSGALPAGSQEAAGGRSSLAVCADGSLWGWGSNEKGELGINNPPEIKTPLPVGTITVVVCALTSNLQRAEAPGNVLLHKGEGNLKKASVVNVSQLYTVDRAALAEKIGALTKARLAEIFAGFRLLLEPRDV